MTRGVIMAAILFFLILVPVGYSAATEIGGGLERSEKDDFFPKAAEEAIKKSQGEVLISMASWSGHFRKKAYGFLIADNWIITDVGIFLDVPIDVLSKVGRVTFNGNPVVLRNMDPVSRIAILYIEEKPKGMSPVVFADSFATGDKVYAAIYGLAQVMNWVLLFDKGLISTGRIAGVGMVAPFTNMPFQPHVVSVEHIYVLNETIPDFLGTIYVNGKGEVIGMGFYINYEYTALLGARTIQDVFLRFLQRIKGKPA